MLSLVFKGDFWTTMDNPAVSSNAGVSDRDLSACDQPPRVLLANGNPGVRLNSAMSEQRDFGLNALGPCIRCRPQAVGRNWTPTVSRKPIKG